MPVEDLRERIRKARLRAATPIEDENDGMLKEGEATLGVPGWPVKILVSKDGRFMTISGHPANPGFSFTPDGAKLNVVRELRTDVEPEKHVHGGGQRLNPIIKYTSPNIVTYYPVFVTPGPAWFDSLLKGSLGVILGLIQRAAKERSDAR